MGKKVTKISTPMIIIGMFTMVIMATVASVKTKPTSLEKYEKEKGKEQEKGKRYEHFCGDSMCSMTPP
jgi:hypothetical protein